MLNSISVASRTRTGPIGLGLALVMSEARARRACIVCLSQADGLRRAAFWFLQENYSSLPTLETLRESQGFCTAHVLLLVELGGQRQLTYVAEVLSRYNHVLVTEALAKATSRLARLPLVRPSSRELGVKFLPVRPCFLCQGLADHARWAINDLSRHAGLPDVNAVLEDLCLPHALDLASIDEDAASPALVSLRRRLETIEGNDSPLGDTPDLLFGRFLLPATAGIPARQPSKGDWPDQPQIESWLRAGSCVLCQARLATDGFFALQSPPAQDLCLFHRRRALDGPTPPAIRELVQAGLASLDRLASSRRQPALAAGPAGPCAWCSRQREVTGHVLDLLGGTDPAKLVGAPLCVRDLPAPLAELPREATVAILETEAHHLMRLHEDCWEYFRKLDYRYQHEAKGAEQTAWLRAAALLWSTPPSLLSEGANAE